MQWAGSTTHPTVDRSDEIGQDGVAGHEDHIGVQSGVGGNKTFLVVGGERPLPGALKLPEVLDLLWSRPPVEPGGLRLVQDERAESWAQVHPDPELGCQLVLP